jgi:adenylate cyclase
MDIGFRVGLDFGDDSEVLWSSYGFSEVHEVTATSFHVDASAKLQSMASKDNAMLGGNLLHFLDLPDLFTSVKNRIKNGERVEVQYLIPNYQTAENVPLNYPVRELNYDNMLCILPLPTELKGQVVKDAVHHPGISFRGYVVDAAGNLRTYPSLSECLSKNSNVLFELQVEPAALLNMQHPLRGKFVVKNWGKQAADADELEPQVETFELHPQGNPLLNTSPAIARLERSTRYRGVHFAMAEVRDLNDAVVFSDIIAVHIE